MMSPLREPKTIGRALTNDEAVTLIKIAASRPEWETAYLASVIALSSTLRGCEVKGLRWRDIDLAGDPPTLTIQKSKTQAGERQIPLTAEAFEAFVKLQTRAELFGNVLPEHFVFARFRSVARFNGNTIAERRMQQFDPPAPITSWRTAGRKLTTKAGLKGLRCHDCRHTAITDLLTNPNVSVQTAKSIAVHIDQRMIDRYAHIQLQAKPNAIEALSSRTREHREHSRTPEKMNMVNTVN
jgi:integrase